ncbi:PucR family transcriptional regulator ligand-binding domain-containing protein [uncultured Nocardioides sp.]|uniref:PucR family transcriptional regulator n=1 Tax=uncultured Nocardioides sp. TaxID=198441 RepID=UPI002602CCE3|nr:PucR family transcriptional regulator ligand-binding domain-containing protein [uncultured Nocardioides sp.]
MLTLAEVLALPVVRSADPLVLAAADRLDRPVEWVHVTELADIGPLLRGGDLVLTTGIALVDTPEALSAFAASLTDSGAAGLFLELGRRWQSTPPALVEACRSLDLPLVALRREVRFAAVTQAVGERLVDEQVAALREAHHVHDVFTELSLQEAQPGEILATVERLAGSGVVLESAEHQVVDYRRGPDETAGFLDDWERRSRSVRQPGRTGWDESNGWLVTRVGRPERGWGRLIIGSATAPSERLVAIAERAAAALALHRLYDRNRDTHIRRLHHELLLGLAADARDPELRRRVALAGVPERGRRYVGLTLRARTTTGVAGQVDELVAGVLRAAEQLKVACLVADSDTELRVLVAVPTRLDPVALVDRLIGIVAERGPVVAAAGTPCEELDLVDRSLRESSFVLAAADRSSAVLVHRLEDVHLRGLLTMLGDDARVQDFAERELAPLRAADQSHGTDLERAARTLVESWGNKAEAALRLNLSRPALYDRIAKLERLLGGPLGDAERRTSLHVAFILNDLGG